MSRAVPEPTTTLYGVLGMLAVRPMSTYELATHFDRSLGRLWPRARSKLYEAPKRLVELGFARASRGRTGRRLRTEYTITPKGRRALAAWLGEPGGGPRLEFESLLKIFYGDHADTDAVVTNLEAARAWARRQIEEHAEVARAYLEGIGTFQERAAISHITGRFLSEFALTVERWATRSLAIVANWPDDPGAAPVDRESMRAIVEELEAARDAFH